MTFDLLRNFLFDSEEVKVSPSDCLVTIVVTVMHVTALGRR